VSWWELKRLALVIKRMSWVMVLGLAAVPLAIASVVLIFKFDS
jgi:hypothetical protein